VRKIPLGATLDDAYKFFFRNIVSIIGTVWFPAALFTALIAAFLFAVLPHDWHGVENVSADQIAQFVKPRLGLFFVGAPLIAITGMLASAMIKAGIMQRALGQRSGLTLFYFSLGAPVWRMAGATIVAVLVLMVLAVLEITAGVALHFALSSQISRGWAILFDVVQVIFWLVVFVYCNVRQFFFLPAVIVAENRIGLVRSWTLAGGNVGRAVVIFLAVVLPVWFVTSLIVNGMVVPVIGDHLMIHGEPDPAKLRAFFAALLPIIPAVVAVHALGALVVTGTLIGGIAKAYKAVTESV
jgi:hypothetical protein